MHHRTTLIAWSAGLLLVAGAGSLGAYLAPPDKAAAAPQEDSLESRVARLEEKLANLERLIGVSLDDTEQIEQAIERGNRRGIGAKASSLQSELQTVRSQMELYQVQHNGHYPDLLQGWSQLTKATDAAGRVKANGSFGPYLRRPPTNPFTGSSRVVRSGEVSEDAGWVFDPADGTIRAILPPEIAEQNLLNGRDVVAY